MSFKVGFKFLKKCMLPKWSTWHTIRSCNSHWHLTIVSHPAFIIGSNFDPNMLFRPLTFRRLMSTTVDVPHR